MGMLVLRLPRQLLLATLLVAFLSCCASFAPLPEHAPPRPQPQRPPTHSLELRALRALRDSITQDPEGKLGSWSEDNIPSDWEDAEIPMYCQWEGE